MSDPHDGWTPQPQEQVQPGDPWRDPTPERQAGLREAAYLWADTPDNDPFIHEVEEALLQAVIADRAALALAQVPAQGLPQARADAFDAGHAAGRAEALERVEIIFRAFDKSHNVPMYLAAVIRDVRAALTTETKGASAE